MPRPKRTKVASTTAPSRVATSKKSTTTIPPQRRAKSRTTETSDDILSDDSDGLVVRSNKPRLSRRRKSGHSEKLTMSGALPLTVAAQADSRKSTRKKSQASQPAVSPGTNTPASNSSGRRTSSGKRSRATPKKMAQEREGPIDAGEAGTFGQDEESSMLDPSLLTFGSLGSDSPDAAGTRPPSAMKIGATPAHESSILAIKNFKRRPRQLSLLRQTQQATDVEDNDDSLDDADLDDLDDFNPEAESTPVHLYKSAAAEENTEVSGLSHSSASSRGKKRKLSPVVQVPRSSPPYDPPSGPDVSNSRQSSPSLPDEVVESLEEVAETQEQQDADIMSETMAPPRSSSPPVELIEESPKKSRQRPKRGASRRDSGNQDSEGEETERPTRRTRKQKPGKETFTTAKLQALLPRRRTRIAKEYDEFDIESSGHAEVIDSEEDELQRSPIRARKPVAPKTKKKSSRKAEKSTMATGKTRRNTRTYGRRASSDKENESTFVPNEDSAEAEEPTEVSVSLPSAQLAAIAKKFQDVDNWEMDFESVDVTGGSSSPWR